MKTKFIAHRGLSSKAPENSIKAFKLAAKANFYGIETDIHSSKDKKFPIFHDQTLNRMTGQNGFIKDFNYDEIKHLKLINGNNSEIYNNELIPLLEDYLNICKSNNIVAVIEIKEVQNNDSLNEILELINNFEYIDKTIIISFNLTYLKYIREISKINLQYLTENFNVEILQILKTYSLGLDIYYKNLTENDIKVLKENNIVINVWTVDDIDEIKKFIHLEVDFITTNVDYNIIFD